MAIYGLVVVTELKTTAGYCQSRSARYPESAADEAQQYQQHHQQQDHKQLTQRIPGSSWLAIWLFALPK